MAILELENLNSSRDFPLVDTGNAGTKFNRDILLDCGLILASSVSFNYVTDEVILSSFEYVGTDFVITFTIGALDFEITIPDTHIEGDNYFADFPQAKLFVTIGTLPPSPLSATAQTRYTLTKTKITYLGGSGVNSIQVINEAPTPPTGVQAAPISLGVFTDTDITLEAGRSLALELQGSTVRFIPLTGAAGLGTPNYCEEGYAFPTVFSGDFAYFSPVADCTSTIKLINGESADPAGFFSFTGGNGVSVQPGVKPSYASPGIPAESSITITFNLPELFNTGKDSCDNPCP